MQSPRITSSDETPAVDTAEQATGHPHTLGVEYTDDETLVADDTFGENPDAETHLDEKPESVG